jgi:hypothetical protein
MWYMAERDPIPFPKLALDEWHIYNKPETRFSYIYFPNVGIATSNWSNIQRYCNR